MPEIPGLLRTGKNLALAGLFDEPVIFSSAVCFERVGPPVPEKHTQMVPVFMSGSENKDSGGIVLLRGDGVELTLACVARSGGVVLEWDLTVLENSAPIRLLYVIPASFSHKWPHLRNLGKTRIFQNGFQSWTPSLPKEAVSRQAYPLSRFFSLMNHHVDSHLWGRKDGLISSGFMLLDAEKDFEAAILGFLSFKVGQGEIFLKNRNGIGLITSVDYGGKRLEPGDRLKGETLWIARGEAGRLLDEYARESADEMGARAGSSINGTSGTPAGWCSWYEYYDRVTEQDLVSNLEALQRQPELAVKIVQLDDGYQSSVGDWLDVNTKFPGGLEEIAHKIKAAGFRAGLWTAPFFASARSRLYRDHPEYFLRDKRNKPVFCGINPVWRTRLYALDLTHPGVERWLYRTFKTLADKGFDYFKVDFLFAGMRKGLYTDPGRSHVEAYRTGLEIIRRAIGERSFLLGCGAPLGPSIGLVDGMRISADVKEVWDSPALRFLGKGCGYPSARLCIVNNLTRSFMHRTWWLNDPDCLLVRSNNTKLSLVETKILVTILGMTGGLLFLGDNLDKLTRERLELARAVLPPTRLKGIPMDLPLNSPPETYSLAGADSRRLYALINWSEKPCRRSLPVRSLRSSQATSSRSAPQTERTDGALEFPDSPVYFDFWKERIIEQNKVEIERHGVRAILETASSSVPGIAGATFHLTALVDGRIETFFDHDSDSLTVKGRELSRETGRLWIIVPDRFDFYRCLPKPQDLRVESDGRILILTHRAETPWTITIFFKRTTKEK